MAAASSNLVLVAAAPVAVVLWLRAVLRAWQGRQPLLPALPAAAWWGIGVALAVFALWRNLPVPLGVARALSCRSSHWTGARGSPPG
ncbi:hypothetical protein [Nocardioides daphniae]|uniref:hypothetical protein n=1 Tax=Nocardioides daphniae TaxID=402297 RepID=UPI003609A4D7